jgi:hypothetical protein
MSASMRQPRARARKVELTAGERSDLVEYLKSL